MQVAAYIGDGMVMSEGAACFHNCVEHSLLHKALAACRITLAEVKATYATSIQVGLVHRLHPAGSMKPASRMQHNSECTMRTLPLSSFAGRV